MTYPSIEAVTSYVREQLDDNPTPADIAKHFGMSRFTLSRWFRAQTGLSLRDFIAALKIEQGIPALVLGQPVIESQLQAGHASAATYSHRFGMHTGLAPYRYQKLIPKLYQTMHTKLHSLQADMLTHHKNPPDRQTHALTVCIEGASMPSAIFVGLYPKPIPSGDPVLGVALFGKHCFDIDSIPNGIYHLLVCQITPSLNPMDYFRLDHCLRAKYPEPICFPLPAPRLINIPLRPLHPSDPPITVNLPKLIFDHLTGLSNS